MNFGFAEFGLSEMVSFTAEVNLRSRAVMERLGMKHDPADDFDDSSLGVGDRLRRHVLYRPYAFQWGERVLIRGGRGRFGQLTPPA